MTAAAALAAAAENKPPIFGKPAKTVDKSHAPV
jgi:hypothetical protein